MGDLWAVVGSGSDGWWAAGSLLSPSSLFNDILFVIVYALPATRRQTFVRALRRDWRECGVNIKTKSVQA